MTAITPSTGTPVERRDAKVKVLGIAPYAYEHPVDRPLHLFPIVAGIARGSVRRIDTDAAEEMPGVRLVLTRGNAPRLWIKTDAELYLLQSPRVDYRGQFLGAVVADTPEAARHAAGLVTIDYDEDTQASDFSPDDPAIYAPRRVNTFLPGASSRGDVKRAFAAADMVVDELYETPTQHHNPIEPHAIIALWRERRWWPSGAKRLTLYDANQGPLMHPYLLGPLLGLLPTQIGISSPYVGGSFGTKAVPHGHIVLAAMAAKLLRGRPIKFALTRQQMFVGTGYRPQSRQQVRLAADRSGVLTGMEHHVVAPTARLKEFAEQTATPTRMMYAVPNQETSHRLVPLDVPPGMYMRGPGESTGLFATETALDELAIKVGLDPIELRVRNEPRVDPESGKAFSTRNLLRCLTEGAEAFGWADRCDQPRARRDGEWLIGMGVASATYPNHHLISTRAGIRYRDGRYIVFLQASDIGTGARTVLAQIAADALGVDVAQVDVTLGRTGLPMAVFAAGSTGTYTWGSSIVSAAQKFRRRHGLNPRDGAQVKASGRLRKGSRSFARHAYGAHFAEMRVSSVTGECRVARLHGMYAAGRIINPRTARSQFVGAMTMGLGAALLEESVWDPRFGHVVNADLAGYHIAAHADVPAITADWIDESDPWFGPTGAKGIGELGIVGVPAAIGNAIYNATGARLRSLPFTPDKLLAANVGR